MEKTLNAILEILHEMQGDISDLKAGQAEMRSDIARIDASISAVRKDIANLDTKIDTLSGDVGSAMVQLTENVDKEVIKLKILK